MASASLWPTKLAILALGCVDVPGLVGESLINTKNLAAMVPTPPVIQPLHADRAYHLRTADLTYETTWWATGL